MCQLARPNVIASSLACVSSIVLQVLSSAISSGVCACCRDTWWQDNKDTCIQAVGFIDKQILPLDDAWYVEYKYGYYADESNRYHLRNKLKGIDRVITKQQAQTPEQQAEEYGSYQTIDDTQAKELAIQLGLAS